MSTMLVALRVTLVTFVLTGILYPLAVTGVARVLFPSAAQGSLVRDEKGRVVGSSLLGQPFKSPAYFQPRPSAAGDGYDAANSGGSNLGPTSAKLRERARREAARQAEANPGAPMPVPVELVTTSASGLDPHVSPAAARWQAERVASVRRLDPARVRTLVDGLVQGRDLGFLGEPRVNVLLLNIALDQQFGKPGSARP